MRQCRLNEEQNDEPPPTRHMTFRVSPPFAPERLITTKRQLRTLRPNALEMAYCALTSSPGFGITRNGASTRSIKKPCVTELTTRATSTSSGSFMLPGIYVGTGFCSRLGVKAPRDPDRERREDTGVTDVSRKLEGGPFPSAWRDRPALED